MLLKPHELIATEIHLTIERLGKLDPEFKAKWVAALTSGEFEQGRHTLVNMPLDPETNKKYCCLGVAGQLCGIPDDVMRNYAMLEVDGENSDDKEGDEANDLTAKQHFGDIPAILHGTNAVTVFLSRNNDKGASFAEIAQWVNEEL